MAQPNGATTSRLSEQLKRRGIDEATWFTLKNSLFPGAKDQSILMYVDYCNARKIDPLKRPAHIVPMQVEYYDQDAGHKKKVWRDVIMPGIGELRTTAFRTGQYAGKSAPEWGEDIEVFGATVPSSCTITVFRLVTTPDGHYEKVGFPHTEYFVEACATTTYDNTTRLNRMWSKRPRGQLAKCTEAGALRSAFPEEIGNDYIAEEMEGKVISSVGTVADAAEPASPRNAAAAVQAMLDSPSTDETTQSLRDREIPADADAHERVAVATASADAEEAVLFDDDDDHNYDGYPPGPAF